MSCVDCGGVWWVEVGGVDFGVWLVGVFVSCDLECGSVYEEGEVWI